MSQNPSKIFRKKRTKRKSSSNQPKILCGDVKAAHIRFGVGMDVHKDSVMVCICAQTMQNEIVTIRTHKFTNTPFGLLEMTTFLRKYTPISHYLMECTGVYHRPVYHALEHAFPEEKSKIIAMNPLLVHRRLTDLGNKHDKADAQKMAELSFYDRLLRPSYIGDPKFFHLRDILRNYVHAKKDCVKFSNRIHRLLCSVNFMCKMDLKNEWVLHLLDYIATQPGKIAQAFARMVKDYTLAKKSINLLLKHRQELEPFMTIQLPQECQFNLRQLLLQFLQAQTFAAQYLVESERLILNNVEFQHHYQQLLKIPCVGQVSAIQILMELGDFQRFRNWKAFVKFCGIVPEIKDSGNTKSKGRINRFTNKHLRRVLTQVATLYVNGRAPGTDLYVFAHRQKVIRGLPFKKAVIRVAHKLAHIIYNVLIHDLTYDPLYEQTQRKMQILQRRYNRTGTMLDSSQTRILRKDISSFLVTNSGLITSKSRFFLTRGFKRLIKRTKSLQED